MIYYKVGKFGKKGGDKKELDEHKNSSSSFSRKQKVFRK